MPKYEDKEVLEILLDILDEGGSWMIAAEGLTSSGFAEPINISYGSDCLKQRKELMRLLKKWKKTLGAKDDE